MLLRDVAYEMLLQARRRDLHHLAAQTLEALHEEDQAPVLAELAYHYETAYRQGLDELRGQASDYLTRAGKAAAEAYENETARDYFGRALQLTPEDETVSRFDLLLAREAVLANMGDREAQRTDLAALSELAATLAEPARKATVSLRQAGYNIDTSDYPAAIAVIKAAIAQAEVAGDLAQQAEARIQLAFVLYRQGDFTVAREHIETGMELARAGGARKEEARCINVLGLVLQATGNTAGEEAALSQSLAIYREIGDKRGEITLINNLGVAAAANSRLDEAKERYRQVIEGARQIGNRQSELFGLSNLAIIMFIIGDDAAAKSLAEEALAQSQEIEDAFLRVSALDTLSRVQLRSRDQQKAGRFIQEALALARATGSWQRLEESLETCGMVQARLGEYKKARVVYQELLDLLQEHDDREFQAYALAGLADVLLADGDRGRACETVAELLSLMREPIPFGEAVQLSWFHLTAYQALRACGHQAAPLIVQAGPRK